MRRKGMRLISILIVVVVVINTWVLVHKPKVIIKENILINSGVADQIKDVTKGVVSKRSDSYGAGQGLSRKGTASVQGNLDELQLELLGTALGNIKDPIAFIKDLTTGKQGIYRLGNSIRGYMIIKISMGEVAFKIDGKLAILRLSDRARAWCKMDPETSPILSAAGDEVVVSKSTALKEAANIFKTLRQIKVKPHYQSDEVVGLMIEGVAKGSIVEEAGIRDKDIIEVVNNQRIDSYQKALEVFRKVRNKDEIKVCLVRDGQSKVLNYRFEK